MTLGKPTRIPLLAALVLAVVTACDKPAPNKGATQEPSAAPKKIGAKEGSGCRVTADCDQGLVCADDKTCQSQKTIDCRGRQDACLEEGRCLGRDNKCVPATPEDCKKSRRCETDGRCSMKDDKCLAAGAEDCSTLCQKFGRCMVQDGTCIATTDAECRKSEICSTAKRCRAAAGRCVGR